MKTVINEHPSRQTYGFALISVLSLVVILALVAISLLGLSTISLRGQKTDNSAQENAKLALMIALNELQEAAGPDQRATASGSIIDGAPASYNNWTGVWDTANYNPTDYNNKSQRHLTWLVSLPEAAQSTADIASITLSDPYTIFNGGMLSDDVEVDKIAISNSDNNITGKYAYWVEDLGLKADANWADILHDDNQEQAALLSSPNGVNLDAFTAGGSHTVGTNTAANLAKAFTNDSLPLASNFTSGSSNTWLKEHRHDLTTGSYGVFSDMKLGGLKRDLSLAFEMDGDADLSAGDRLPLFDAQHGEFVGGADRLASQHSVSGLEVEGRYLYRDTNRAGSWFSNEIANSYSAPHWASVRGPNWWALRDYANMYKRLRTNDEGYTLTARAYYPNHDQSSGNGNFVLGEATRSQNCFDNVKGYSAWNTELNKKGDYCFQPAGFTYAPVPLGTVVYFSLKADSGNNLALVAEPIFYVWNPYNHTLDVGNYLNRFVYSFPASIQLSSNLGTLNLSGDLGDYIKAKFGSLTADISALLYLYPNLSLKPGEVLALSPPAGTASIASELGEGFLSDETSGLHIYNFPHTDGSIKSHTLEDNEEITVKFALSRNKFGSWSYRQQTYISPTASASTLPETHWYSSTYGDELSILSYWLHNENTLKQSDAEHDIEHRDITFLASELSSKVTFAAMALLANPATSDTFNPATGEETNMEIFTQFNPLPLTCQESNFQLRVAPNYSFTSLCIPGDKDAINQRLDLGVVEGHFNNGLWGSSYYAGEPFITVIDIPTTPLYSLSQFANAHLTTKAHKPMQSVGNSYANVFVPRNTVYATHIDDINTEGVTSCDHTWLLNDALFDRYFFSGIRPDYTIGNVGYATSETIADPITRLYGADYRLAQASSILSPYIPHGRDAAGIIAELTDSSGEGYAKLAKYSLLRGQFNVNSTSEAAWEALLKANKDAAIEYTNTGGTDSTAGTPYTVGSGPVDFTDQDYWDGVLRLDDDEISDLAEKIVEQVRLRGPFMSLSDFVNRRLSSDALGLTGALQAAIDATSINGGVDVNAGGTAPSYDGAVSQYISDESVNLDSNTAAGIAQHLTQPKLLNTIGPRLNARSDTFTIRAYGETVDNGGNITDSAVCEVRVQRLPEYYDDSNTADEELYDIPLPYSTNSDANTLSALNTQFGRKFKIISFKWLSEDEI